MSADDTMTDRDRMESLLPFYLNGTLEGAELAEMEQWLRSDTGAAAALGEAEAEFSATLASNEAIAPPADALTHFEAALVRQAGPERKTDVAGQGMIARAFAALGALPSGLAWGTAAAALLLVAIQASVDLTGGRDDFAIAGAETEAIETPYLFVTFADGADMAAVTALLEAHGVAIADGPKPGGVYRVAVDTAEAGTFDRIAAALSADPAVTRIIIGKRPNDP